MIAAFLCVLLLRVLQACEVFVGHDFGPAGDVYDHERVEAGLIKMPMSDVETSRQ